MHTDEAVHAIKFGQHCADMIVYDIDADGDNDVITSSAHKYGMWWHEQTEPGKFVSLSFWRDRAAVEAWYRRPNHKAAQDEGRQGIFQDYRIRVAEVFRDYDLAAARPPVA